MLTNVSGVKYFREKVQKRQYPISDQTYANDRPQAKSSLEQPVSKERFGILK